MLVFLRFHILAESPVILFPYQRVIDPLDEHCSRDRDWIPHVSIHHLVHICKTFCSYFYEYASHFYVSFTTCVRKRIHKSIYCSIYTIKTRLSRDGPCVHLVPHRVVCGPDGRKAHPY